MNDLIEELASLRATHYLQEVKAGTFRPLDLPTLTRLVIADIEQILDLDEFKGEVRDSERAEITVVCDRKMNEGW